MSSKNKLSTSTALVVVPAVPAIVADAPVWRVYEVYCTKNRASYFGIVKNRRSLHSLRLGFIDGARKGNTNHAACSIRQHGIDAHKFRFVSDYFSNRNEAFAEKGRQLETAKLVLNQAIQDACGGVKTYASKAKPFPETALGRNSAAWGFDSETDQDDSEGE